MAFRELEDVDGTAFSRDRVKFLSVSIGHKGKGIRRGCGGVEGAGGVRPEAPKELGAVPEWHGGEPGMCDSRTERVGGGAAMAQEAGSCA